VCLCERVESQNPPSSARRREVRVGASPSSRPRLQTAARDCGTSSKLGTRRSSPSAPSAPPRSPSSTPPPPPPTSAPSPTSHSHGRHGQLLRLAPRRARQPHRRPRPRARPSLALPPAQAPRARVDRPRRRQRGRGRPAGQAVFAPVWSRHPCARSGRQEDSFCSPALSSRGASLSLALFCSGDGPPNASSCCRTFPRARRPRSTSASTSSAAHWDRSCATSTAGSPGPTKPPR